MGFDLHQNFVSAVTLHQAGRLSEAEGIYRNILAIDPKHLDSLHLLGVIALQFGQHDVAVELIGQAVAANKRNAEYHNNLGVAARTKPSSTSSRRSGSSRTIRMPTTTSAFCSGIKAIRPRRRSASGGR
jgi:tetratricopeptide (TPR) repeat protein